MLDELAADCQEVVHLVERDNSDVIYIYKAEPARPLVRMASYVGCRNPMYCTGVGKSILAYLPDEEVIKVGTAPRSTPTQKRPSQIWTHSAPV